MSDEVPYSKKDQRKLSSFLGHEMLYDYLSQKLDPERMKSMDRAVAENREIQDEIQSLNSALNYVEHLAESDIAEGLLAQVKQPISYAQVLLQKVKFHEWPQGLKLGLEVLLVTSIFSLGAIFLPWHQLLKMEWGNQEIVLSELKNDFKDNGKSETETDAKVIDPAIKSATTFQDEAPDSLLAKVPPPEIPVAPAKPADIVEKAPPISESVPEAAIPKSGVRQGWLFRGSVSVVNVGPTSEKFVVKIGELGGRKAGEVELGWKKAEGAYFHFTIPEAKYEELSKYFTEYGTFKVQKEKHERIMSDGIIRMIVTVNENKKTKAAAPIKKAKVVKETAPEPETPTEVVPEEATEPAPAP